MRTTLLLLASHLCAAVTGVCFWLACSSRGDGFYLGITGAFMAALACVFATETLEYRRREQERVRRDVQRLRAENADLAVRLERMGLARGRTFNTHHHN